jgi:hypothetical protein
MQRKFKMSLRSLDAATLESLAKVTGPKKFTDIQEIIKLR